MHCPARLSALLTAVLVATASLDAEPAWRAAAGADPLPVTVCVDARTTGGELRPIHRFFGADEPNCAIDAVRRALPTARVGGPDTAGDGGKFMQDFLEHCLRRTNYATGRIGTPLDFISFHAKGQASVTAVEATVPGAHGAAPFRPSPQTGSSLSSPGSTAWRQPSPDRTR